MKQTDKTGGAPMMGKPKFNGGLLKRLLKMLIGFYPVLLPISLVCMVLTAVTSAIPAIFLERVTKLIEKWQVTGDWSAASAEIMPQILVLGTMYLFSLLAIALETSMDYLAGLTDEPNPYPRAEKSEKE